MDIRLSIASTDLLLLMLLLLVVVVEVILVVVADADRKALPEGMLRFSPETARRRFGWGDEEEFLLDGKEELFFEVVSLLDVVGGAMPRAEPKTSMQSASLAACCASLAARSSSSSSSLR